MRKFFAMLFAIIAVLAVGCGNTSSNNSEDVHADSTVLDLARPVQPPADFAGKRVLVAFFSRTGENFEVGYIEREIRTLLPNRLRKSHTLTEFLRFRP